MPWMDLVEAIKHDPPTKKEIEEVIDYRRRKAKPKFYADENFPTAAVRLIRSGGFNVLTAHKVELQGHPDENHAAYALKNARVLLTCDRDYLNEQRFPLIHCPANVIYDFGSGSLIEMQQTFRCLRTMFSFPQVFDKWVKIDAKRESWTEYCRFLNGTTSNTLPPGGEPIAGMV